MYVTTLYTFIRVVVVDVTKPYMIYKVWGTMGVIYEVWGHGCHNLQDLRPMGVTKPYTLYVGHQTL